VEPTEELRRAGAIEVCDKSKIKLRVARRDVARAAAFLLERYPVADLTVEEPEIGTIIERIMARRQTETAP
jgi:ABC-type uncharacterized transport system ATPase subunit